MTKPTEQRNLDGRDEFLIALIAGFIPFVTLGALVF